MKGDTKIIEYLNKALLHALTAIDQFFLHARMGAVHAEVEPSSS